MNLNEWTMIAIGLAVILAVVIPVLWIGRWRSRKGLRSQFGPEYEREVSVSGSRSRAVDELEARRRRVASYELRELAPADKEELTARWRELQKDFVERPSQAVAEAAALIDEAMERRGYPLGEIRHKDADLSVHYPREVQAYREACTVAERSHRGDATTEELREAMVSYRVLFDHLLGNGYEPRREIAS